MAGLAQSTGVAGTLGKFGIASGLAGSLGGSSSDSEGSREIAASTVQKLSDNITQSSASMRELQSTVVVQTTQNEKETIETRTVANYNHSHALTILYYEVLRHFRVVTEYVRARPIVLAKLDTDFLGKESLVNVPIPLVISSSDPGVIASLFQEHTLKLIQHVQTIQNLIENRPALEAALLDKRHIEGFNALQRVDHRHKVANVTPPPPALESPPSPADSLIRFFNFDIKTGGLAVERAKGEDNFVNVHVKLNPTGAMLNNGGPINPPGAFTEADRNNSFSAWLPPNVGTIKWGDIDSIEFSIKLFKEKEDWSDVSFWHIKVTGKDLNGNDIELIDKDYNTGHLILQRNATFILPTRRPPPAPAAPPPSRPVEEIEDDAKINELIDHLRYHRAHYSRALYLNQNITERARQLDAVKLLNNKTLLEKVENRPLEMIGDFVAYPCANSDWANIIKDRINQLPPPDQKLDERLITLPTRGLFAEAKLGHCNASEEIDNTRFWDWQQSPIPHMAPDIAAIQAGQHLLKDMNLQSTPFPQSMVNIVNPPAAPDPTGLAAAMNVLGTPNIFRDMSGRAEVADLLKKLSDNTIGIAEAANRAREIQAKSGGGSSGSARGGSSSGGAPSSISGPRALPTQPSSATRDLHDMQNLLQRAQDRGLTTPEAAQEIYNNAQRNAYSPDNESPQIEQVGDHYVPPATGKTNLIGLVGEQNLAAALERDGLIVFRDWSKHVNANGFDLIAMDNKVVWLIDNKGQISGIGDAKSLTGTQFAPNKDAAIKFLKDVHPHPKALDAAKLLEEEKFIKVAGNGWSGAVTRFTRGLFAKGLYVYDIRLGDLFTDQAKWEQAYNVSVKLRGVRRLRGVRGAATVGGMLFTVAVAAGALWVLRSGESTKQFLGETAAQFAFDAVLSKLPGGFIASFVVGLESDETEAVRKARKRKETINEMIPAIIPDYKTMSEADLNAVSEEIGKLLDDPLVIVDQEPAKKQFLPGFDQKWLGSDDWT